MALVAGGVLVEITLLSLGWVRLAVSAMDLFESCFDEVLHLLWAAPLP